MNSVRHSIAYLPGWKCAASKKFDVVRLAAGEFLVGLACPGHVCEAAEVRQVALSQWAET